MRSLWFTNYLDSRMDIIFTKYVLLKKTLYDIKQTLSPWCAKLTSFLFDLGFINNHRDSSLFTLNQNFKQVWLLIYVDDLIFTSNCINTLNSIINLVCQKFKCRDLGTLRYFLETKWFIYIKQSMRWNCYWDFAYSKLKHHPPW